jgi:hydroxymethylpyrimidine pyrophosphatase-like HAD family hydrolase
MRYLALATDYDGTIATRGLVDELTVTALVRARMAGVRLILVTGRELNDLDTTFPRVDLFDRVVAENGAVLFDPATGDARVLCRPPPSNLLTELQAMRVPVFVGRAIVATHEPYEQQLSAAIRELGLDWHVILNKGSIMALPSTINKATGLRAALEDLRLSADRTVGVGDAENDEAFMDLCGVAVAVANALPAIKRRADAIMQGEAGSGVCELIDLILGNALTPRRLQL